MVLRKIAIENFRSLKDFEMNVKDELSLIVGKNNSGKTSVLTALDKMVNSSKILWQDISLDIQEKLYKKIEEMEDDNGSNMETIRLRLFIEYNDSDSFKNIQSLIMDLDPENNYIVLEFVVVIREKEMLQLKKIVEEKELKTFKSFSKYMSKYFYNYFYIQKFSREYNTNLEIIGEKRTEQLDNSVVQKVIKVIGIKAERDVSNNDKNRTLSALTNQYYSFYKKNNIVDPKIIHSLEKQVEKTDEELNRIYNGSDSEKGVFADVIDVIKKYGGVNKELKISIESDISEGNLLLDNTSLCYEQGTGYLLPESYNGLGYLNLIGILFELETKFSEIRSEPAEINIIYVEEPEAHTHPQLQYIFIRNIKEHIHSHREALKKDNQNKAVQILLTTHSSHIVAECDFDDIIYLKKEVVEVEFEEIETESEEIELEEETEEITTTQYHIVTAKGFNCLRDMYEKNGDKDVEIRGFKFVKQYLTLNRSELFFSDKVICIEGDTERILMPAMIHKLEQELSTNGTSGISMPLLSQNISIIEVGAYAHIFIPLFEFLGIKVLIVTDIDAGYKKDKSTSAGKCHPKEATHTTNACIRHFFNHYAVDNKNMLPEDDTQFDTLVNKKAEEKVKGNIKIAYQIPEKDGGYQASSFEDAFFALNKEFIIKNKDGFRKFEALKEFKECELNDNFYEFAQKYVNKKSAFASSILYFDEEDTGETWKVPRYIKEGLLWLREN